MNEVRLIYCSRSTSNHTYAELRDLMDAATRRNEQRSLTGLLLYGDGAFLQALEGDRDAVNGLYAKLVVDPRHTDLTLLQYEPIRTRRFGDWSMRLVHMLAESPNPHLATLRRTTGLSELRPTELDRESAFLALVAIADEIRSNLESRACEQPAVV